MDALQIALIFLIFLIALMLSVLGIQVFLILKGLQKSLARLDKILSEAQVIGEDLHKPLEVAADITDAVKAGVKMVKAVSKSAKPAKKLFFRRGS